MTFALTICASCSIMFTPPPKSPYQRCCSRRCGIALSRDIRRARAKRQIAARPVKAFSKAERAEINAARIALLNAWDAPVFDEAAANAAFMRLQSFAQRATHQRLKKTEPAHVIEGSKSRHGLLSPENENREAL